MPHVTMVVRAGALRAALNDGVQEIEPDNGGRPFENVALTLNGTTAVAYWCGWRMTTAQLLAVRNQLQLKGLTVSETNVVTAAEKATFVPDVGVRFYAFTGWERNEILTALGLTRLRSPTGPPV